MEINSSVVVLFSVGLLCHSEEKQAARCESLTWNKQKKSMQSGADYAAVLADNMTWM